MEGMNSILYTLFITDVNKGGEIEFMKLKTYNDRIKYMMHMFDDYKMIKLIEMMRPDGKSVDESRRCRSQGNKLYKSVGNPSPGTEDTEVWHQIYILYSKSIAYAPKDSKELAFGYSNRAAASFKVRRYTDCLSDLERGLNHNSSDKLRVKLLAMKAQCLVTLDSPKSEVDETLEEIQNCLETMDKNSSLNLLIDNVMNNLTYKNAFPRPYVNLRTNPERNLPAIPDDNPEIKGASSAICIKYSKEYGRHLVASRDIEPGKVLMVQKGFSSFVTPDRCYEFCCHCCKQTWSAIPCNNCVTTCYCSELCRQQALLEYHDIECQYLNFFSLSEQKYEQLSSLRSVIKAVKQAGGIKELMEMVGNVESHKVQRTRGFTGNCYDGERYESYYSAPTLEEKRDFSRMFNDAMSASFAVFILATESNFFGERLDADFSELKDNELVIFIGGLIMKHYQLVTMTRMNCMKNSSLVFSTSVPFRSLLAHSCNANTDSVHYGRYVVLFSFTAIKKDEPLFADHECSFVQWPKPSRTQNLQNMFHLNCKCIACEENWPTLSSLPSCQFQVITLSMKKLLHEIFCKFVTISSFKKMNRDPEEKVLKKILIILKFFNKILCEPYYELYFIIHALISWFQMRGIHIDEFKN